MQPNPFEALRGKLADRSAAVGVIGLGYVGLPLAVACARQGFPTLGFDIDPTKIEAIAAGRSYIGAVSSAELARLTGAGTLSATGAYDRLAPCDVIVICVPTPLSKQRDPDLSYVEDTAREIAARLRPGQLVVLESTTYPGTTREVLKPILEAGGLVSGRDVFVGFSPEREDPGNTAFETVTIPKVVAGDGAEASELVQAFYGAVVKEVVPVSSPDVAEAVKITENVFRAVNIALVNELKLIYDAMGIDVWEVIEAAKTKPFGYMPFYPGPGLGGHCIPIDPFYLTWRSREFEVPTRFIELAGEINTAMPNHVVEVLARALDARRQTALSTARILVIGLAYKKNVADVRESPTFKLMTLLERRGAEVAFHDPHVEAIPPTREHAEFAGRRSVALTSEAAAGYDAVLIATDHDAVDYAALAAAPLVVDTRNVMARRGLDLTNVVKA
ncbi:nucleotide sugar dehydrogenase [Phenylobacterium sp. J367]|uniref:nucleotide sugar dehydrogenase n=1 Tax=Phenylobacterium sp. J367 TaxID=2898435 RepID=UPI0021509746|nr:nucleotide sugar dehydrogenase [Phenylobacterium sp. J367]MCR5879498.1 nucleotide sugar dehydrogenase [Phenylobacterium sp. J367]